MRKKRGYNRETPVELLRDYKLFAIACEGSKREPEYFHVFRLMSGKIAVDTIEEIVSDAESLAINPNKSSPRWVLDRAMKYIEKEGLNNEDELWFVMDVDRWSASQLLEIYEYCCQYPNWNIALSNYCFEVWLYFHKKTDISQSASTSCSDFKYEISTFENGGYHPYKFLPNLPQAITNAKAADSNPAHYLPNAKETKVYKLAEALLNKIGKPAFDRFIEITIPSLIKNQIAKSKGKVKK